MVSCVKKEYRELVLPIPRSSNYMSFAEFAVFLSKYGVQEKTIEQIYKELIASKVSDSL